MFQCRTLISDMFQREQTLYLSHYASDSTSRSLCYLGYDSNTVNRAAV